MKKKGVSTLKIAATYIGTVVGAGFATGQEILQFFSRFGVLGLLGIFLAAALFVFFGYLIMMLLQRIQDFRGIAVFITAVKRQINHFLGSVTHVVGVVLFQRGCACVSHRCLAFRRKRQPPVCRERRNRGRCRR